MLLFALPIFLGAFLLFQVQPLLGKYLLPWFGGSPGVWTTCLLFFQTLLLGGYAYAHFVTSRLAPRRQATVHLVVLALSLASLPIIPADSWKPAGGEEPIGRILLLLLGTVGLPYLVLSATGPLLQSWFARVRPGASPYRLYALSNVGSLLALLSYPVLVEPHVARGAQAWLWSAGHVAFVGCCGWCAWRVRRSAAAATLAPAPATTVPAAAVDTPVAVIGAEATSATAAAPTEPTAAGDGLAALDELEQRPLLITRLLWVLLPAVASVLLMATTNRLTQDVAVVPFLWVLPLALYLVSFILTFDHARWYRRGVFAALLAVSAAAIVQLLETGNRVKLPVQILTYGGSLFVACMVCHGELYRLRPPTRWLTSFYLSMSVGGALGGLVVGVLAPLLLDRVVELQAGWWLLTYLVGVLALTHRASSLSLGFGFGVLAATLVMPAVAVGGTTTLAGWAQEYLVQLGEFWTKQWALVAAFAVMFVATHVDLRRGWAREWRPRQAGFLMLVSFLFGVLLVVRLLGDGQSVFARARNFYGPLTVFGYAQASRAPEEPYLLLQHGSTTHGMQFLAEPYIDWPTSYYGDESGVGLALRALPDFAPRRIGVVGLGAGTLAVHAREGDTLRFYEIDPGVVAFAREHFHYLDRTRGSVEIVLGDARLSLENELAAGEPQRFDVLALDAFSSDSIPVHLLTREAMEIYARHLSLSGVLAIHISNRYLDLEPVVRAQAEALGLHMAVIHGEPLEVEWWVYRTTWILLSPDAAALQEPLIAEETEDPAERTKPPELWTDDRASLWRIVR